MCVSAFPADFTGTRIGMYKADPAVLGHPTRVMLYQNTTRNRHSGANAMLLHVDAATPLGPGNFIPTTNFRHVLDDMVEAVQPPTRGMRSIGFAKGGVQIFDSGIYTVVLASNASEIPGALNQVPEDKRPNVNIPLFDFYGEAFPGYSVALCCFNRSAVSEPIMLWWEPMDSSLFRMPGLDEHTGHLPNLHAEVEVDHWLMAGAYDMKGGDSVEYTEASAIPEGVRQLLPDRVVGRYFWGHMKNGDFGFSDQMVKQGYMPDPLRLSPPAAA